MLRYFFDFDTGQHKSRDDSGIDLPDLNAVAAEVFSSLRDLVQGEMPEGHQTYVASVRDEAGRVVYHGEMRVSGERFER